MTSEEIRDRNQEIVELRKRGVTLNEIGFQYGMSGEHVRQICFREERYRLREKRRLERLRELRWLGKIP